MSHRSFLRLSACVLLFVTASQYAWAWGKEGHHLVALLAQKRLTKEANRQVAALLQAETLVSVSTWPDEIRKGRPETAGWHYVSIPRTAAFFDDTRDCRKSGADHMNCVVDRINYFARTAADAKQSTATRVEALKFLVHFVGDIHQPMHAMDEGHGANDIKIVEFGSRTCGGDRLCNLHAVWDSGLIDHSHLDERAYAKSLERMIKRDHLDQTPIGTPDDWANESHRLAEGALLANGGLVDELYYREEISIVNWRLSLAGIRLAAILNTVFR